MATVQVRDVPDEVAEVITERARETNRSVSAYLRDLMAADARAELQRRAIARWDEELDRMHERLGLPDDGGMSSVEVVRKVRDESSR